MQEGTVTIKGFELSDPTYSCTIRVGDSHSGHCRPGELSPESQTEDKYRLNILSSDPEQGWPEGGTLHSWIPSVK